MNIIEEKLKELKELVVIVEERLARKPPEDRNREPQMRIDLAVAKGVLEAFEYLQNHVKCRKCGGQGKKGQALQNNFSGIPDFPGDSIVTMSPDGTANLIDCLKCEDCGHSWVL